MSVRQLALAANLNYGTALYGVEWLVRHGEVKRVRVGARWVLKHG